MAIPTEPTELAALSKCYACLDAHQIEALKTYLLAVLAGGSLDVETIMAEAKCFMCIQQDMATNLQNYLLCQAVNTCGGSTPATCGSLSGSGNPTGVTTPEFSGQLYHDTVADTYYYSTGTTSADWTAISGGACVNVEGAGDPT